MERLQGQKRELLNCASVGNQGVASLKERVWELESNALEQEKVRSQQENTIKQLEQVRSSPLSRGCTAPGRVLTLRGAMETHCGEARCLQESHPTAIPLLLPVLDTPVSTACCPVLLPD